MNCALWLNRRKIISADEIRDNFDCASLRGYFLAGTLVEWLNTHGGEKYAAALAKIPEDCPDLNSAIAKAFGFSCENPTAPVPTTPFSDKSYTPGGSFGSFQKREWDRLFGRGGSFSFGSGGSFRGFHEWEWEWLFRRGGSFSFGSGGSFRGFHEWEWEWLFRRGGSFGLGSGGSFRGFHEWEWEWLYRRGGSFSFGSGGSFRGAPSGSFGLLMLDEYDRIMYLTLMKCPLDRFGYGIHII